MYASCTKCICHTRSVLHVEDSYDDSRHLRQTAVLISSRKTKTFGSKPRQDDESGKNQLRVAVVHPIVGSHYYQPVESERTRKSPVTRRSRGRGMLKPHKLESGVLPLNNLSAAGYNLSPGRFYIKLIVPNYRLNTDYTVRV